MAGSSPFLKAYNTEVQSQADLINRISSSKAEAEASKYKTTPNPPKSGSSFGDALAGPLATAASKATSGLLGGLFGGSSGGSFESNAPWNFNSGLNFLPSGSSGIATNFSPAGISGPSFTPTSLNFFG
jgi:hypothetical protein